MLPFKTINCEVQTFHTKKLAMRMVQKNYQSLEREIIINNAIVVIDFKNLYDLTWTVELENAPQYLIDKFKRIPNNSDPTVINPEL